MSPPHHQTHHYRPQSRLTPVAPSLTGGGNFSLLVRQHVSLVEDERLYASLPPLPPITGPCPPPELEPGKRGPAGDSADDPDSKRSRPEPEAGAGPSVAPAVVPPPPSAAPLARMDTIGETTNPAASPAQRVGAEQW